MKIKTGDMVSIVNSGHIYPSYVSFFEEQGYADLAHRHVSYPGAEKRGRVLFMGKHRVQRHILCAVELEVAGGPILIIGVDGVEFVSEEPRFDLPDIELSETPVDTLLGV